MKSNDGPSVPPKPDKSSMFSRRTEEYQTTHDLSQPSDKDKDSARHSKLIRGHLRTNITPVTHHDGCETNWSPWIHLLALAPHLIGSTDDPSEPTLLKLKDPQ